MCVLKSRISLVMKASVEGANELETRQVARQEVNSWLAGDKRPIYYRRNKHGGETNLSRMNAGTRLNQKNNSFPCGPFPGGSSTKQQGETTGVDLKKLHHEDIQLGRIRSEENLTGAGLAFPMWTHLGKLKKNP